LIFFTGKDAKTVYWRRIICDTSKTDRVENATSGKKQPSGGKSQCKIRVKQNSNINDSEKELPINEKVKSNYYLNLGLDFHLPFMAIYAVYLLSDYLLVRDSNDQNNRVG